MIGFPQFFEALWGIKPFPWQERLAQMVLEGNWPRSIGLPTAAGKTALIDIAVFALAARAPRAARRIFFVVDRRVIVDEAAKRAADLACKLRSAENGSPLWVVSQRLREIGGDPHPLETSLLRGGIPRDDSWTDSPIQPVVVATTVDQVGSSLLFRAYGTSEYGWPIRAGLTANDALIILDEAHTSQPFAETLEWVTRYRTWAERPLHTPFTVVEMSATPRDQEVFREAAGDHEHPILSARWTAEKRTRLVAVEAKENEQAAQGGFTALVEAMAREARAMRDHHGAKVIGVVVNRVQTARRIFTALRTENGCAAVLLTGRARPHDRDQLWERWRGQIEMGRAAEPERPIFVVATQSIEVGANISFDSLVTEIASVDALEQRFGRLDRGGNRGVSYAVVVAQKDQIKSRSVDAIYGEAPPATWKWLEDHKTTEERVVTLPAEGKKKPRTRKVKDEFVSMGVSPLRAALAATGCRDQLNMPKRNAPVLMPPHVDLLAQTSPPPAVSPEPAVFLHGPETGPADLQVIWRQDLGEETNLWADIAAMCPPSAAEAISLPVWTVRKWLGEAGEAGLADVEGLPAEAETPTGKAKPVLCWRSGDEAFVVEDARGIRPGMTIVVPSVYGGCDEWGWDPESRAEVSDIGDMVKLAMGRPILRLHPKLTEKWGDSGLAERISSAESVTDLRAALAQPLQAQTSAWVERAVLVLASSRVLKLIASPGTLNQDNAKLGAITGRGVFDQQSVHSSYMDEIELKPHLAGCREWASRFAADLPPELQETAIQAAALHDLGKVDPRFQAWLRGGIPVRPQELIAKSKRSGQNWAAIERARRLANYPKGGRHELLSVALLQRDRQAFPGVDFDLLLHLVASHHGRCRPFAPTIEDRDPRTVTYGNWTASLAHGLDSAGSGICDRFWRLSRTYGWWGLAYLEALVRLADCRQSESEESPANSGKEGKEGDERN